MSENFDSFPSNIAETSGPISKNGFVFRYNRFEVWQGGACIYSGDSNGEIKAQLNGTQLDVSLEDAKINSHIKPRFSFAEISTNGNRIMWSKDIFNTNNRVEKHNPDISSLFFRNGVLAKVTYTIHDPNTLVEFYAD